MLLRETADLIIVIGILFGVAGDGSFRYIY